MSYVKKLYIRGLYKGFILYIMKNNKKQLLFDIFFHTFASDKCIYYKMHLVSGMILIV